MSGNPAKTSTGGEVDPGTPPANEPLDKDKGKSFSQDDLNRAVAAEKRAWQKRETELKNKADAWDKQEESKKSEEQKATEKAAALERENLALKASIELGKARNMFGRKYNIPEVDWDRLRGSDPKEIEEDAKGWAKTRGLDKAGGPTPPGAAPIASQPFNRLVLNATGRGGR
jgi:hypothetical protein